MIVTRIAYSENLTARKFSELEEIARRLGKLRHELWDRFGSLSGYTAQHRPIRDRWIKEGRVFHVPARLWKETLRDVIDDIQSRKAAGFKAVIRRLYRRYGAKEGKELAKHLRAGTWQKHPVIHRYVRDEMPRGRTWVNNQIVLDTGSYTHFTHHGTGLGKLLTEESDQLKAKYQRRNKLRAIAEKKPHKAQKIKKHNLGRLKINRRKSKHVSKVKTVVHSAAHAVAKKASVIVHEDLSVPIKSKKQRGKNTNRRLAGWVKGMIQEA